MNIEQALNEAKIDMSKLAAKKARRAGQSVSTSSNKDGTGDFKFKITKDKGLRPSGEAHYADLANNFLDDIKGDAKKFVSSFNPKDLNNPKNIKLALAIATLSYGTTSRESPNKQNYFQTLTSIGAEKDKISAIKKAVRENLAQKNGMFLSYAENKGDYQEIQPSVDGKEEKKPASAEEKVATEPTPEEPTPEEPTPEEPTPEEPTPEEPNPKEKTDASKTEEPATSTLNKRLTADEEYDIASKKTSEVKERLTKYLDDLKSQADDGLKAQKIAKAEADISKIEKKMNAAVIKMQNELPYSKRIPSTAFNKAKFEFKNLDNNAEYLLRKRTRESNASLTLKDMKNSVSRLGKVPGAIKDKLADTRLGQKVGRAVERHQINTGIKLDGFLRQNFGDKAANLYEKLSKIPDKDLTPEQSKFVHDAKNDFNNKTPTALYNPENPKEPFKTEQLKASEEKEVDARAREAEAAKDTAIAKTKENIASAPTASPLQKASSAVGTFAKRVGGVAQGAVSAIQNRLSQARAKTAVPAAPAAEPAAAEPAAAPAPAVAPINPAAVPSRAIDSKTSAPLDRGTFHPLDPNKIADGRGNWIVKSKPASVDTEPEEVNKNLEKKIRELVVKELRRRLRN